MDLPVTEEQIRTLAFFLWEKARQQLIADSLTAKPNADSGPIQ